MSFALSPEGPWARDALKSRFVSLTTHVNGFFETDNVGIQIDLIEVHNEMVKRVVPPERLLVVDLKEGWQLLCKFLDRPVPREPFPRLSDSEEADKVAKGSFARCLLVWVGIIGATAIMAHTVARFLSKQDLRFIKSAVS